MILRIVLIALLCIPACYYALRYNMHMFQQNGYKNTEHRKWLMAHARMQWVLVFGAALGILRIFLPALFLDILLILTLLLIWVVYRAMCRMSTKKKFVVTPRVRRMFVTCGIFAALILALTGILTGVDRLPGVCMVLTCGAFLWTILANVINHPMEAAINRHYINDARRKLKAVPGIRVIGVTGSYGKTSVKFYLKELLSVRYNVLATPESYNTPMGVVRTIRESLQSSHQIFLCEMGARNVGDIKEICDIVHPHDGVITAVGPQHLETFHTMENIAATKFELADALPKGGKLFLNGDSEPVLERAGRYESPVIYRVAAPGAGSAAGYVASGLKVSALGTDFTVTAPGGETEDFHMRLVGAHNVINVLGAIAVAHSYGIPLAELKIPVRRLQSVEHRMQLREQGPVTVIDDAYNSNPVGSKAAVETLKLFEGLRILITPGMVELGDREEEYNRLFGTYAAACCDYIFLVGAKRAVPIREGALSAGFPEEKCRTFDRFEDAFNAAVALRDEGHKYILIENDLPDAYAN